MIVVLAVESANKYVQLKIIELQNGKPIFNSNCTHCLACFHWCPKEAIYMKNFTIKNRRKYHNPNIKLNEIIRK